MNKDEYVCIRHADAQSFLARAERWLILNEAEHNLILGIATQLQITPPYKLSVTRMPAAATHALAADVIDRFDDAPSVLGPEVVAGLVADRIAHASGKRAVPGMRQRIYQLTRVKPPEPMPSGKLRLAQTSDYELLIDWLNRFGAETSHGRADVRTYTQSHITNKTVFLWDDDGPKTTALWAGLTPNGVRIGFVYTPPEHRGRGYASACVADASQRALDSGYAFCCLYTNLSNATSNKIYQEIGYEPVADVVDVDIV